MGDPLPAPMPRDSFTSPSHCASFLDMSGWFTLFTNCRYVLNGGLVDDHLVISDETGLILKRDGYIGGDVVDLDDNIVAPGFLELHTNGVKGFHFTQFERAESYAERIDHVGRHYATQGVTGFWATIPTVKPDEFQKILPSLQPRDIPQSASLLGAHAEGPYLHPSKKGAHNSSLFQTCSTPASSVYGPSIATSVKLVTLAPELPNSPALIKSLTSQGIRVSMGHTTATYEEGIVGLKAGATCLTHTLNAMPSLQSRAPGLAGLVSLPPSHTPAQPYYTIIPDGEHLHSQTVSLLHRCNPKKSILVTDSIELADMPDGTYPGHSQIPFEQMKRGTRATIAGTDTLIGGCIPLQQGVRNLMQWSGCSLAEAVGTVSENVAGFMGIDGQGGRGILKEGRRADLCVLSEAGEVLQTWVNGTKVWDKEEDTGMREDDGEIRG